MTFFTIQSIKDANKAIGHYFFSRETMRFFRSRVHGRVYHANGRTFIITSERGPSGPRAWTIREVSETGAVETAKDMGGFQAFNSLCRAKTAIKQAGVL